MQSRRIRLQDGSDETLLAFHSYSMWLTGDRVPASTPPSGYGPGTLRGWVLRNPVGIE
jgi:hypothetical protein